MDRSCSPVRLHLSRNTPVHVHVSGSPAQHDSKRTKASSIRRLKASDWVKASTSKGPWVPPPAKTSSGSTARQTMFWEGGSHRLEISPAADEGETRLRLSDLDANTGTDIILDPTSDDNKTQKKLDSLLTEVGALRAEVDQQRLTSSHSGHHSRPSSREKFRITSGRDERMLTSPSQSLRHELAGSQNALMSASTQRELLLNKMSDLEQDCSSVSRLAGEVRETLRKLLRDKSMSPSRARDAEQQSRLLQNKMDDLELSTKTLKRLLRTQQKHEEKVKHVHEQQEVLLQRLAEAENTVTVMRGQLGDQDSLAAHSRQLHDQLSESEASVQQLRKELQALTEKFQQKELDYTSMEITLRETAHSAIVGKEALKRAAKQHKDRAAKKERTVETLAQEVESLSTELEKSCSKIKSLSREKTMTATELQSYKMRVQELESALDIDRKSNKSSLKVLSEQLTKALKELNSVQTENRTLKSTVTNMESQLKTVEATSNSKVVSAEAELEELHNTVEQFEQLITDYKTQLQSSHEECQRLAGELRMKEQQVDQVHQDSALELEKAQRKFTQHISELEGLPSRLKSAEAGLRDAERKLTNSEQKISEHLQKIALLTAQAEQNHVTIVDLRNGLQESSGELKRTTVRLEECEKRLQDTDKHNRELIALTSKKEGSIQRMQRKTEELLEEISLLRKRQDTMKSESRKQTEDLRDRLSTKERANLARITELESQLSRANSLATQLRESKDEIERKLQTKIYHLQETVRQTESAKNTLENYIKLLKTTYTSVTSDTPTALY